MPTARDVLTPEALSLLEAVAQAGSFAAAARELNLVPSAVTYRIRQIEDALDVLLFDRSSRQARLTEAGTELLREGGRLLQEIDAVANRVRRVATGWESELTIAVDTVVSLSTVMELTQAFFELAPGTRLRMRDESLSGTLEALSSGQADLALGLALETGTTAGIQSNVLGEVKFVFAVAPHHPLAAIKGPLKDEVVFKHRAVAVADSVQRGQPITRGLLAGRTCSPCRPCAPSSMRSCAAWARASCPSRWRAPTSRAAGSSSRKWSAATGWFASAMHGAAVPAPAARSSGGWASSKAPRHGTHCSSGTARDAP